MMKSTRSYWGAVCVASLIVSFLLPAGSEAAVQEALVVELQLHGAVFQRDHAAPPPLTLSLSLEEIGDVWQPVAGRAVQNNKAMHSGRVTEAGIAGEEAKLRISMNIHPDPYVRGGRGEPEHCINWYVSDGALKSLHEAQEAVLDPAAGTDRQRKLAVRAGEAAGTLDQAGTESVQLLEHPQRRAFLRRAAGRREAQDAVTARMTRSWMSGRNSRILSLSRVG